MLDTYMLAKIIFAVLVGIFAGPVVSIVITPVFCLLRTTYYVPFIRGKLREEAPKNGHVVEAHLVKKHTLTEKKQYGYVDTMKEMGKYVYYVKGRKYVYHLVSYNGLDKTISLFYIKNPRKATVGGDLGNFEVPWFKIYLILSLVCAVALMIVSLTIGFDWIYALE